jgi:RNA polymerase sigma-70 factor (ECF subfamily)
MLKSLSTESREVSVEAKTVTRDLANRLLAQLSPEDRIILVLLDVEGLSVNEIAKMMDWSAAKVKIRTFRARSHLRRLLSKFL